MPASKAQQKAVSKYMKANYDEIKMEVVGKANLNEWGGRVTPQIMIENYEIKDNEYGF